MKNESFFFCIFLLDPSNYFYTFNFFFHKNFLLNYFASYLIIIVWFYKINS